ncbi:MAG: hypothetical protein H6633_10980 [Anaerolineales bacterium]|nr:hypothetical protein [Anaerolineales bacterium]
MKDIFIDGTERPCNDPKGQSPTQALFRQAKEHTVRNLVVTDEQTAILCLTPTKPGSRQDYHRFKQSQLVVAVRHLLLL